VTPGLPELRDDEIMRAELYWAAVSGELLSGLTHALSNRVGTLMAVAESLDDEGGATTRAASLLDEECIRLTKIVYLLRALPPRRTRPPEPLSVGECLNDAIALLRYHPDCRNVVPTVAGAAELPAAWGRTNKVRRALVLALLAGLPEQAPGASCTIQVTCSAAESAVVIVVGACSGAPPLAPAMWAAVAHYARLAGAECREVPAAEGAPHGIEFRIPTLEAAREQVVRR
jgi:hypothetical protein